MLRGTVCIGAALGCAVALGVATAHAAAGSAPAAPLAGVPEAVRALCTDTGRPPLRARAAKRILAQRPKQALLGFLALQPAACQPEANKTIAAVICGDVDWAEIPISAVRAEALADEQPQAKAELLARVARRGPVGRTVLAIVAETSPGCLPEDLGLATLLESPTPDADAIAAARVVARFGQRSKVAPQKLLPLLLADAPAAQRAGLAALAALGSSGGDARVVDAVLVLVENNGSLPALATLAALADPHALYGLLPLMPQNAAQCAAPLPVRALADAVLSIVARSKAPAEPTVNAVLAAARTCPDDEVALLTALKGLGPKAASGAADLLQTTRDEKRPLAVRTAAAAALGSAGAPLLREDTARIEALRARGAVTATGTTPPDALTRCRQAAHLATRAPAAPADSAAQKFAACIDERVCAAGDGVARDLQLCCARAGLNDPAWCAP